MLAGGWGDYLPPRKTLLVPSPLEVERGLIALSPEYAPLVDPEPCRFEPLDSLTPLLAAPALRL